MKGYCKKSCSDLGILDRMSDWVKETSDGAKNWVKETSDGAKNWFTKCVGSGWEGAQECVKNWVKECLESGLEGLKKCADWLVGWVIDAIKPHLCSLKNLIAVVPRVLRIQPKVNEETKRQYLNGAAFPTKTVVPTRAPCNNAPAIHAVEKEIQALKSEKDDNMMQKYITEDKSKQLQRIKNEIESARHETSFLEFDYLSSAPEALKKAIEKVRAWLDGANVEMYKRNHREMWAQALSIVLRLIQADVAITMVARLENRAAEITAAATSGLGVSTTDALDRELMVTQQFVTLDISTCMCAEKFEAYHRLDCRSKTQNLEQCVRLWQELDRKSPACKCPVDASEGTCGIPLHFDLYGQEHINGVKVPINSNVPFDERIVTVTIHQKSDGVDSRALTRFIEDSVTDNIRRDGNTLVWEDMIDGGVGTEIRKSCASMKWSIDIGHGAVVMHVDGLTYGFTGTATNHGRGGRRRLLGRGSYSGC